MTDSSFLLVLLASSLLWGAIGVAVARWKWRSGIYGAVAGALLGGLGVLILAVWPRGGWSCPSCRQKLHPDITRCWRCGWETPGVRAAMEAVTKPQLDEAS